MSPPIKLVTHGAQNRGSVLTKTSCFPPSATAPDNDALKLVFCPATVNVISQIGIMWWMETKGTVKISHPF